MLCDENPLEPSCFRSFLQSWKVFAVRRSIWLVAGRFGLLQKFSASAGVFERSFLQEGDQSNQAALSLERESFDRDHRCTKWLCMHVL